MSVFYQTKQCAKCHNMGIRYNYFENKYEDVCSYCGYKDVQQKLK